MKKTDQVTELKIYRLYCDEHLSILDLSRRFGLADPTIRAIIKRCKQK